MMGKTHFAVGLAVSLIIVQPDSFQECLTAVIGGTVGGVLADNDILDNDHRLDTFSVQFFAAAVTVIALVIDSVGGFGIWQSITENQSDATTGGIVFAALWLFGVLSKHRTFTHSLTALLFYTLAVGMIYPPLTAGFAAAYLSHLLLDLTNKKKLPLLYPLNFGICFKLFYADGLANKLFMSIGFAVSGVLLMLGILASCG